MTAETTVETKAETKAEATSGVNPNRSRQTALVVGGLALVGTTAFLFAAPLRGPAATFTRALKDEASVRTGRFSYVAAHREADFSEPTPLATVLAEVRKAPVKSQRHEAIVFSGADFRREVTMEDRSGAPMGRLVIGVQNGVSRAYQEIGHGEKVKRDGTLGGDVDSDPAAEALRSRTLVGLKNVQWQTEKQTGEQLVLAGKRGDQTVTLTLRTRPRLAAESVITVESQLTPRGPITHTQQTNLTYDPNAKGGLTLKTFEFMDSLSGAINGAVLTTLKMEGAAINDAIRPEELSIEMQAGTKVVDQRVKPLVIYPATGKELTLAEAQALGEQQRQKVAQVDRPAPPLELKTLDGKTARVADYKGKILVLTWFASWCGPCNLEAPHLESEIWQPYRDKGVQVFGVNAGEEEDPEEKARTFVRRHNVTYPIMMDVDEDGALKYGVMEDGHSSFPTTIIIDRKGIVRYKKAGLDPEEMLNEVKKLLAEQ